MRRCPGGSSSCSTRTTTRRRPAATYYENALAKARVRRSVGEPAAWMLGEDSGIEVAALDGRPGIASARWASDGVARAARAARAARRTARARYVCELVALGPDGRGAARHGRPRGHDRGRAAGQRGLRLRPDLRAARRVADCRGARERLEARRTRTAPAPPQALSEARGLGQAGDLGLLAARSQEPVHLGAEDDHVRHHVQPDEQQRRGAERLQGDDVPREPDEER